MRSDDPVLYMDIATLAGSIERREVSPVELVEACLRRVEEHNPALNAFITVTADLAMASARRAEEEILRGRYRGPLHGIPIAHKDVIKTRGVRTTAHSRALDGSPPEVDATVVRLLAEAGAVSLGKVNTYEFACGATESYGVPLNPWDQARTTGGSSAGSVSAVADALCFGATGTDTGGSIRGPSSYCGVVGFKPTYGTVGRTGVYPLSWSLDHVGPITRTARDAALMYQAMLGADSEDPSHVGMARVRRRPMTEFAREEASESDLRGKRIGVPASWLTEGVDESIYTAQTAAIQVLESQGAEIRIVSMPLARHSMAAVHGIIAPEATAAHASRLRLRGRDYAAFTRQAVLLGTCLPASTYLRAQTVRRALWSEVESVLREVDLLVWPTTRQVAPPVREPETWGVIQTQLLNLTGHPSLSVPCGFDSSGLPIGMLITGRMFDDAMVLRAAMAYQAVTPWQLRRPEIDLTLQPLASKPYASGRLEGVGAPKRIQLEQAVVGALRSQDLPAVEEDVLGLATSLHAVVEGLAEVPEEVIARFEPLVHHHVTARTG